MLKSSSTVLLLVLLLAMPVLAGNTSGPERSPSPSPGYGEVYGSYMGIDIQEVTHDRVAALKLKKSAAPRSPWWTTTRPRAKPA